MEWIRANWFWIVVTVLFLWMHMGMHGHGGHGRHGSGTSGHDRSDRQKGHNRHH